MEFYIETYGCAANKSDSEIIAGILKSAGFNQTKNIELADLIIINTCVIKQPTENKILERIREIQKKFKKKKILITGCMPSAYPEILRKNFPELSMISGNRTTEILKVVRKMLDGKRVELLGENKKEKVCLPKIRENKVIDIVQICSGCLGNCAYCGGKLAKGQLFSYSIENIVKEIKSAKEQGCKEFWLTGQDVSCYGFDSGSNLSELIKKILEIRGKYFIRIGMLNPIHLLKIIDNFLKVCEDERIFKFFHIPVQSGSDKVLREMNRNYAVKDFEFIVKKIRNKFKRATIWTDIIVGYPTETEEDFQKSINLLKKVKPDWTNVSKFGVRRKTKAARLKPLDSEVVKERSIILSELAKKISIEQNKKWLNWEGEILIDEFFKGRNFAYKSIHLNSKEIGKFVKVRINRIDGLKLFGEILDS